MDQRSRGWVFTLNNYTSDDEARMPTIESEYLVYGKEVGESGTPHLQGYVYFTNARTGKAVKKLISDRCHIEKQRGTNKQAAEYCKKEGQWKEFGTMPEQGKRNDLIELRDLIASGEKTAEDIAVENPQMYHVYGRTLEKIEDITLRLTERKEMTKGIWYYGPTGVGKSHSAFNHVQAGERYVHKFDHGWWDNYRQQPTVILNEFRGQLTFSDLLSLVDKWPYHVSRRGRPPMPFTSQLVIVTSDAPPHQVYKDVDKSRMDQIYRRFEVIQVKKLKEHYVMDWDVQYEVLKEGRRMDPS